VVDGRAEPPLPSNATEARAPLAVLALLLAAGAAFAQESALVSTPQQTPRPVPSDIEDATDHEQAPVGPTPGAPTLDLHGAVRLALEQNFALLDSSAAVTASRWQRSAASGEFLPQVVPLFSRGDGRTLFGLDVSQRLPWTGGTLVATGRYVSQPDPAAGVEPLFPRTTDLRLLLSQPLLRGAGPNATYFDLTNAKRAVAMQERTFELARQRLAVQVASAFYSVIAQRQLFEVADQSLQRTESLLDASDARLKVGMASKLDVFRAELQAAQAREGMIRTTAALETALEQFRGILALPPDNPVEPEGVVLEPPEEEEEEPVEMLVRQALEHRLELKEARDRVSDARRASSLARQNLLPQVDLNLGVTQLGFGRTFGGAFGMRDRQIEFFISASYPFRQTTQKANRAVSEISVQVSERAVAQIVLEIEREVHLAARDLDRIRQSVVVQLQSVGVAGQQRRLAVLRYQRGLASNFDVVDAESNYVVARSALVSLLTSYAVARLELRRATGTLSVDTEFAP
jgi:outer membrane protein